MNNTTTTAPTAPDLTVPYLYIGCGAAALGSNSVICFVLIRNINFLKRSAFIAGLCVADLILGSGMVLAGTLRIDFMLKNITNFPVHPLYCLHRHTSLLMVSVELDSAMMFMIGTERLIAVAFFRWYYAKWTNQKAWLFTSLAFLASAAFLTSAWITVANFPANTTTPIYCTTGLVVGDGYTFTTFGSGIVSGTWAICMTLFATFSFMFKKKKSMQGNDANLQQFINKQWQITLPAVCLGFLDFCLVVIPNLLIVLSSVYPVLLPASYWALCCICLRSSMTIVTYTIVNRDFRGKLFTAFGFKDNVVHHSS